MWIIMERQFISPEVIVKGFSKCCISITVDEIDDILWNGSKEDGNTRSVRKMKALTMKMETVTNFFFCGAATKHGSWPPHS
jgi:hypothetical protein